MEDFYIYMKSKIFKFIFILSFIPYVYILCWILFGRYIVNGAELHGIERLLESIKDIFQMYIALFPIIPICLTFQMCYIFRRKSKIMFMCSFIPYIFVLLTCLQYAFFGVKFLGSKSYGLEGFLVGIIYYVMGIPLLPICLIVQIIGYISNRKKNLKEKSV